MMHLFPMGPLCRGNGTKLRCPGESTNVRPGARVEIAGSDNLLTPTRQFQHQDCPTRFEPESHNRCANAALPQFLPLSHTARERAGHCEPVKGNGRRQLGSGSGASAPDKAQRVSVRGVRGKRSGILDGVRKEARESRRISLKAEPPTLSRTRMINENTHMRVLAQIAFLGTRCQFRNQTCG